MRQGAKDALEHGCTGARRTIYARVCETRDSSRSPVTARTKWAVHARSLEVATAYVFHTTVAVGIGNRAGR